MEGKSVEEIVKTAPDGAVFNNAGQVLNHELYFTQFAPKPAHSEPVGKLAEAIVKDFGSFDNFTFVYISEYSCYFRINHIFHPIVYYLSKDLQLYRFHRQTPQTFFVLFLYQQR